MSRNPHVLMSRPMMGGRRRTIPVSVAILAIKLSAVYLARYESYLRECESYREQGYTAHFCEHGTNRWTDYDNICGGCEDGYSMGDGVYRRQTALAEAKSRIEKVTAWYTMKNEMKRYMVEYDEKRYDEIVLDLLDPKH